MQVFGLEAQPLSRSNTWSPGAEPGGGSANSQFPGTDSWAQGRHHPAGGAAVADLGSSLNYFLYQDIGLRTQSL